MEEMYCLGEYPEEKVRDDIGIDSLSPPEEAEPFASAHKSAILTRMSFVTDSKKMRITLLGVVEGDMYA